tara:strand:- start:2596 stop:3258 length:663 start_codon:yes stop_codon:yes gene_type:complete
VAGEIVFPSGVTGQTLYGVVRSFANTVWNGSSFESYASGNWGNYDIALTEQGSSSVYVGTFPGSISAGSYHVTVYRQAGGSVAETDPVIGSGGLEWTGSAVLVHFNASSDTVDVGKVSGDSTAADNLEAMLEGLQVGTVDNSNFTPTTTAFETDLTEASDDHFNNQAVLWRSGANAGLTFFISDSVGKTGGMAGTKFTVDAMPNAAANGDTFQVIGTKGA